MKLPEGFTASGIAAGLKRSGRPDLGIIASDRPAVAAGVFTTNRVQAAPITLSRRLIRRGTARAIVVNAGNANACTGKQGLADAKAMGVDTARALGVNARDVLVASTGIIGVPMDMPVVTRGIAAAAAALSPGGLADLARAIMTTDTTVKHAAVEALGGSIVGIAKGAGMIAPEMATMLAFIVTDLRVERGALHEALTGGSRASFDMISVDGCRSTNDCVFVLANGAAGGPAIADATEIRDALGEVCSSLARQIVDDGEGATKLVRITVNGATTVKEARRAAATVADSVLLRCAMNGEDPNWGRVLAALGTAPIPFDPHVVDVWLGGEKLCESGAAGPGDLAAAATRLKQREIDIVIEMHRGEASATMLTNDLSAEYVRINSEYTT